MEKEKEIKVETEKYFKKVDKKILDQLNNVGKWNKPAVISLLIFFVAILLFLSTFRDTCVLSGWGCIKEGVFSILIFFVSAAFGNWGVFLWIKTHGSLRGNWCGIIAPPMFVNNDPSLYNGNYFKYAEVII